jgi:uncharacterized membrane protein YhaH (DUF805 family)
MRTPVAAGALTALVAGGVMAVLASSTGGLAASLPAIAGLTAVFGVAGVVYGWLVHTERLRAAFGPGILYWSVAFPAARLIFELAAGDGSSRSGLSDGLMPFLVYQAMVGGAFGLGFILLHNQITALLGWLVRPREEEVGKAAEPPV